MIPLWSTTGSSGSAAMGNAIAGVDECTMSSDVRTLSELFPGQSARVLEVTAPPSLALHILEIGLVRGAKVRFLRAAPLGGPIEIEVEGFLLSLRRNEADMILVGIDADGPTPRGA